MALSPVDKITYPIVIVSFILMIVGGVYLITMIKDHDMVEDAPMLTFILIFSPIIGYLMFGDNIWKKVVYELCDQKKSGIPIRYKMKVVCPICGNKGGFRDGYEEWRACKTCNGHSARKVTYYNAERNCNMCKGSGFYWNKLRLKTCSCVQERCWRCNDHGVTFPFNMDCEICEH